MTVLSGLSGQIDPIWELFPFWTDEEIEAIKRKQFIERMNRFVADSEVKHNGSRKA